jgi:hypothetical protein
LNEIWEIAYLDIKIMKIAYALGRNISFHIILLLMVFIHQKAGLNRAVGAAVGNNAR